MRQLLLLLVSLGLVVELSAQQSLTGTERLYWHPSPDPVTAYVLVLDGARTTLGPCVQTPQSVDLSYPCDAALPASVFTPGPHTLQLMAVNATGDSEPVPVPALVLVGIGTIPVVPSPPSQVSVIPGLPPPPSLILTAPVVPATPSPNGQSVSVTFAPMPSGGVPPYSAVTCLPASGSAFVVGSTSVDCQVSDAANQFAETQFSVVVTYTPPVPVPATWTLLGNAGTTGITDLARDPGTGELCVSSKLGPLSSVRCTLNDGVSWQTYSVGGDATFLAFTPFGLMVAACKTTGGCSTAGAGQGVYRRVNGSFALTGLTGKPMGVVARPDGSAMSVALSSTGANLAYRTTDGQTWTPVSPTSIFSGYGQRFKQAPNGDLWVGTEGQGTRRSTDGGVSWTEILQANGNRFSNVGSIGFLGSDVFVGGVSVVARWTPASGVLTPSSTSGKPYYQDSIYAMAQVGAVLIVGTKHAQTGTYQFDGATWTVFHESDAMLPTGGQVWGLATDGQVVYAAIADGRLLRAVP